MNSYTPSSTPNPASRPSAHKLPLLFAFIFALFFLQGPTVLAETATTEQTEKAKKEPDAKSITARLDEIERELKAGESDIADLDDFLSTLNKARSWGEKCAEEQEPLLAKTDELLTTVGEPIRGELPDVAKQRSKLKKDKSEIEKQLTTCHVIVQRSEQIGSAISARKKSIQAEELLARGPGLLVLLVDTVANPGIWLDATKSFITDTSGLSEINRTEALIFILITGLAVVIGWFIRARAKRAIGRAGKPGNESEAFTLSLLVLVRRYVIALLGATTAAVLLYTHGKHLDPIPFINIVAYGLPLVLVLTMTASSNLLARPIPVAPSKDPKKSLANRLSRRLKVLIVLIFIGYLLFSTILAQSLPETIFLLARMVYGVFLIINLIWILWLLGSTQHGKLRIFLRVVVSLLLTASLVSAIFGYHNLAQYIFKFVAGTMIVLGIYFIVSSYFHAQLDALDEDKGNWQHKLRSLLGLKSDQPVPGLLWIRLLITLALWVGLFSALTTVWQVPQASIEKFEDHIVGGFVIGSFTLKPLLIVQSILVLALLLTLNSWFKKWLEQEWLARARMDRGARESIATISGYVGTSIAILVALSVAGMDFSKLAIIAGALSVGIGFGLQNIVSNFISGLILLFERPVKTGDWIIVGDVEGYVKRISIRTTQIMTFDRADVIVPNTELISGNVTNLMLNDQRGRLRVPVGVAYGSDTQKVKELLLEVAKDHPEVIGEGFGVSEPVVLFIEFGDSSLNFELRCFITDIDRRRRVISDLNFAIDEAFRENGIEIPFPQRDVHIKDNGAEKSP